MSADTTLGQTLVPERIPALGMLCRLPQELRDVIYEYTIESQENEVTVIFSDCRVRSMLLLASRV